MDVAYCSIPYTHTHTYTYNHTYTHTHTHTYTYTYSYSLLLIIMGGNRVYQMMIISHQYMNKHQNT